MMPVRKAACEPCRLSKLACDHARPICGRCVQRGQECACAYRTNPFKKRQTSQSTNDPSSLQNGRSSMRVANTPIQSSSTISPRQYPNPGYLGPSRHAPIFEYFQSDTITAQDESLLPSPRKLNHNYKGLVGEEQLTRGQNLLEKVQSLISVRSCVVLVNLWIEKGINLALAGPFVALCAQTVDGIFIRLENKTYHIRDLTESLFQHTCSPLSINQATTFEDFCRSFCDGVVTWEALGIFFTAVSRATCDIRRFPGLYISQQQRRDLQDSAMRLADGCLDVCLQLDCLNDLQLMLQYENFINHSCANGDESYQSWKRMGDVISSIYALGYHDQVRTRRDCPKFVTIIREATFAFSYSADKNISIFLGRPPRMIRQHCNFDFLDNAYDPPVRDVDSIPEYFGWKADTPFTYMTEAWWSMVCAVHKEEALGISRENDRNRRTCMANKIQKRAEKSWSTLPERFRPSGDLISASHLPIERDFVASARLNYLHVMFLLQLSLSDRVAQPEPSLLAVAADIFGTAMEAAIIKEYLTNSGTGIQWKISYYALPAVGVLCLSLVNRNHSSDEMNSMTPKFFQDLGVFVAQVETKALIDVTESNYALLSEAARTIKMILSQALRQPPEQFTFMRHDSRPSINSSVGYQADEWVPWANDNHWDFEMDFWTNLAEHPSLLPGENLNY